ncbi:dihydrofolate reductase family protein [Microbacterium sp. P01]|uniref:dihydrofolate reductase family protein n=1 Tax=Microbacterium sp. P01 TaxID=3366261 RepID=UPI003671AA5F
MIVTEIIPHTLSSADAASADGRRLLTEAYTRTEPSYVRLNMITSVTGSAAGDDGTSETLTNRVDRMILGIIRRDADVVLVGAQSVRAEGYVVPRSARLAIVTTSGDLSGHRLTLEPGAAADQVLLVCPADRAAELAARTSIHGVQVVAVAGGPHLAPAAIIEALAERDLRRVVCEGGPGLASQFAEAGVIDEYCVTVAPVIEQADAPFLRVGHDSRPVTDVAGMVVDGSGFSYLRLRRRT